MENGSNSSWMNQRELILRVTGTSEKSDDSAKDINNLLVQVIAGNLLHLEKEFNICVSEVYRTLNSHGQNKKQKTLHAT